MSITFANLQDNRAMFQIIITLLRFPFDSPYFAIIFAVCAIGLICDGRCIL